MFLTEGAGELPQYANSPATEIVRMERGFGIPRAFWDDMNRSGTTHQNGQLVPNQPILDWLFTLGYPTTEAFWTKVKVGGVEREVMFQAFERRLADLHTQQPAAVPGRDGQCRPALLPVALRGAVRGRRRGRDQRTWSAARRSARRCWCRASAAAAPSRARSPCG